MADGLNKILSEIEDETGVFAAVFSDSGVILGASTYSVIPSFPVLPSTEESFCHEGYYYHILNVLGKRYYVVVCDGANARTFAVMVGKSVMQSLSLPTEVGAGEIMKQILSGQAEAKDVKRLREEFKYPTGKYFVLALSSYKDCDSALSVLSILSDSCYDYFSVTENGIIAYVKYFSEAEEQNILEFARTVRESAYNETGALLTVCAGEAVSDVGQVGESYFSALVGLKTALKLNYGKTVFSYREFLIVDMLAALPVKTLEGYRKRLLRSEVVAVMEDVELTETVGTFLNCSLNVSETARALFIHRNTLSYRLNKIEKDTGLDVRSFSDAVTFRILEFLYKTGEAEK